MKSIRIALHVLPVSENEYVLLEDNLEGFCFSKEKMTGHGNDGTYVLDKCISWMEWRLANLNPFEVLRCFTVEVEGKRSSSLLASWHAEGEKMEMLIDFWTFLCVLKRKGCLPCYACGRKMFYVGKQLRGVFCFCFFGFCFQWKKNMCDRPLQ